MSQVSSFFRISTVIIVLLTSACATSP
ncbi:MAG: hypothetical protein ACI9SC_002940, partial [Gammaproteobacteria bacterium]